MVGEKAENALTDSHLSNLRICRAMIFLRNPLWSPDFVRPNMRKLMKAAGGGARQRSACSRSN